MKSFIDFLFGDSFYEIWAKAGFAGAVVGAIGMKNAKIAERLAHIIIGLLTSIFIGPLFFNIVNFFTNKYWGVKLEAHSIVAGIGFLVGISGIKGLQGAWISLKLNGFVRKFLLFLLKK